MWTAMFSRPSDVSAVRQAAGREFQSHGFVDDHDLILMLSELVTNAVVHGRAPRSIAIEVTAADITVKVSDASLVLPQVRHPEALALGGNGMRIIDQLASAWGVDLTSAGKTVWIRQDRTDLIVDLASDLP